ncbi:MAG: hypothetical protein AB2A00_36015 [Myxococcota bacterium]
MTMTTGFLPSRSFARTRARLGTLALSVGLLGLGACEGCPLVPPGTEDAGVVTLRGQLFFSAPSDNANLTLADDADPSQPGFQVQVEVRGQGVADGTVVTLKVDTRPGEELTDRINGGIVRFRPTLAGGPFPGGKANKLEVSAPDADGAAITVKVIENTAASCSFRSPANGANLFTDGNTGEPGFQTDVTVACAGTTVQAEGPVRLEVFQGLQTTGTPVLTVPLALSNGEATFQSVTLPEGDVTLQASVRSTSGQQVGHTSIRVRVDTGRCDAQIISPPASSVLTTQNSTDLDPSTPETLDLNFTVTSVLCPGGSVSLQVNDATATGNLSAGTGVVRVALPQGSVQVVATIDDGDGPRQPGDSPAVSYTVDTLAPCPALTAPAANAILTAGDDEEVPPNAANGVTYTLRGTVTNAENTSQVNVNVLRGMQSFTQVAVPLSGNEFSLPLQNMTANRYTVRLSAVDTYGNACSAPDQSFDVNLDAAAVTVAIVNDTQPADTNLIRIEDASATDDGMQAVVRVRLQNANPSSGQASVTLALAGGAPIELGPVTLAGDGTAEFTTTLADGDYSVVGVVSFGDGRPAVATVAPLDITVDGTPPELSLLRPADGVTINTTSVDVEVQVTGTDLNGNPVLTFGAQTLNPTVSNGGVHGWTVTGLDTAAPNVMVVSVSDLAGNRAEITLTVNVDTTPPTGTLSGLNPDGESLTLSTDILQPTRLDISTTEGALALDYNNNAADGLQYGFAVELSLEDCASLGANPVAVLDLPGNDVDEVVALTTVGAVCRGTANNGGAGYTLPDGLGEATLTLVDVAGNVTVITVYLDVYRAPAFVRIDSPQDNALVNGNGLVVQGSTNLSGTGTCTLVVDGTDGPSVALASSLAFPGVDINNGASVQLLVRCANAQETVTSLPVTVLADSLPPANAALRLSNGTPIPPAFNLGYRSEGQLGSGRYTRTMAVEVDAEGGCSRLRGAVLTTTPQNTVYNARGDGTGGTFWQYSSTPTERCTAFFDDVDFGLENEPGFTTTLSATVADSAGNSATVQASVLTDQVAPELGPRTSPVNTVLGSSDDAVGDLSDGFQVTFTVPITADGRAGTVTFTCSGNDAETSCPAPQVVAADATEISVTVTVADGSGDASVTLTMDVVDAAGNASSSSVGLAIDLSAPVAGNPALTLDDGTPLPTTLNATMPSQVSGTGRYLRDLGLELDAENGACDTLGTPTLNVSNVQGNTDYVAGAYTLVGGTRCRALFDNVDLGDEQEDDLTSTLTVTLSDAAGNRTQVLSGTVVLDVVAPQLGTPTPADGTTLGASGDFDSNPGNGIQVQLSVPLLNADGRTGDASLACTGNDGETSCPTGQAVAGNASDVTLLATVADASGDANVTLTLTVTDGAGNSAQVVVALTVDLTAPAAGNAAVVLGDGTALPAAFNASAVSSTVGSGRFTQDLALEVDAVNGSCDDVSSATLTATPTPGGTSVLYTAGFTLVGARCRAVFPAVDLGSEGDAGTVSTLDVTVTDAVGNTAPAASTSLLLDQVAPVLGSYTAPRALLLGLADDDDDVIANGFQLTLDVAITNPDGRTASAQLTCTEGANQTAGEVQCPATPTSLTAGATSAVLTGITVADGSGDASPTVTLVVSDAAGNVSNSVVVSLTLDLTAATLTLTNPTDQRRFKAADDARPDPGFQMPVVGVAPTTSANSSLEIAINGGSFQEACNTGAGTNCAGAVTLPDPPDGTYAVVARMRELSGNTSASINRTVYVDTQAPVVTSITVVADVSGNNDGKGTLVDESVANQAVAGYQTNIVVTVTGVEDNQQLTLSTNVAGTNPQTAAVVGGQVTFTVTLFDGAHTLQAAVSDLAGNPGSGMQAFLVDVTAPTVSITQPNPSTTSILTSSSDADGNSATSGYQFGNGASALVASTSAADGDTCTLRVVNDGTFTPVATTASGAQVAFGLGTRVPESAALGGTTQLQVQCTDANGNVGVSSVFAPQVDTLAPQISAANLVVPLLDPVTPLNEDDTGASMSGIQARMRITHDPLEGNPLRFVSVQEGLLGAAEVAGAPVGSTDMRLTFFFEAVHNVSVYSEDAVGNSDVFNFQLDIRTGTINVTITPRDTSGTGLPVYLGLADDQDSGKAGLQPLISVETSESGSYTATLEVGTTSGLTQVQSKNVTGTTFSFDVSAFPANILEDGLREIRVTVNNGIIGGEATTYYYVDTTRPVVAFTADGVRDLYNLTHDELPSAGLQTTLKVTVSDCGTSGYAGELVVSTSLGGGTLATVSISSNYDATSPLLVPVTLDHGNHTLTVTCTDVSNNTNQPALTYATAVDAVAPTNSGLTYTAIDRRRASLKLNFTAAGDDGDQGATATYSVAMSTQPITTDAQFTAATPVAFTHAGLVAPGNPQVFDVTDLAVEQQLYFAVRAEDDQGNASIITNANVVDLRLLTRTVVGSDGGTGLFGTALNRVGGDINGDGFEDIVVGVTGNDSGAGEVHVYYGSADMALGDTTINPAAIATTILKPATGNNTAGCGAGVFILGDLDGDGFDDVMTRCGTSHNKVYLWYGASPRISDGAAPVVISETSGGATTALGFGAAGVDFNGDNIPDLAIGEAVRTSSSPVQGTVWILYGTDSGGGGAPYDRLSTVDLATLTGTATRVRGPLNAYFGAAVTQVPSFNSEDTIPDLVVGSPFHDGANTDMGRLYVVRGRTGAAGSIIDVSTDGTNTEVREVTGSNGLRLGYRVMTGDFNGDGVVDVAAAGESKLVSGTTYNGGAYIYTVASGGGLAASPITLLPSTGVQALQIASLRDFNGDGSDDLGYGIGGILSGFTYPEQGLVVLGSTGLANRLATDPNTHVADYAFSLDLEPNDPFLTVAGGSDVNNDGYPDLIIANKGGNGTNGQLLIKY